MPASAVLTKAQHLEDEQVVHNAIYRIVDDAVSGPTRRIRHPALFDGARWTPTTCRARRSAWPLTRLRPGEAPIGVDVVGQSEHPLGDDVALDLARAAADRQGLGEQVAVVPARVVERRGGSGRAEGGTPCRGGLGAAGALLAGPARSASRRRRRGAWRAAITCWPCSSPRSCGCWPRRRAARPAAGRSTCAAGSGRGPCARCTRRPARWRISGSVDRTVGATASSRSSASGRCPTARRPSTARCARCRAYLGQPPAVVLLTDEVAAGIRTSVKNTSLNV